jgi:rhodanese-related sulfurtransferase
MLLVGALLMPSAACRGAADEMPRIDPAALKAMLGDPQLLIVDVRSAKDWAGSDQKVQGALRQDPDKVAAWAPTLPKDKKIVLYCA